jgi:hypothetical protein
MFPASLRRACVFPGFEIVYLVTKRSFKFRRLPVVRVKRQFSFGLVVN